MSNVLTHDELGRRIKQARRDSGITQTEASETLGISRQKLVGIEKGVGNVDTVLLSKMATLFGFPIEYFVSDTRNEEPMALAFRAGDIKNVNPETINWARNILSNAVSLEDICGGLE